MRRRYAHRRMERKVKRKEAVSYRKYRNPYGQGTLASASSWRQMPERRRKRGF